MLPRIAGLPDRISRIGRILRGARLPQRNRPAFLNFCVHTELIYDDGVYNALLKFSRDFRALTGVRMAICVTTPLCPPAGDSAAKAGVTAEEFASRIIALADCAEIGYHGHFYDAGRDGPKQISGSVYDKGLVVRQIDNELDWLNGIGIRPKIYIAGWWFLSEDIVLELERRGIETDHSVRKGRADTFGARYLTDANVPDCGRTFFLPPSRDILEIQSLFGPVMAPPLMRAHLSPYMERYGDEELFFVFPLHDWDVPKYGRNIWSNVMELTASTGNVRWSGIDDMRRLAMRGATGRGR